MKLDIRSEMHFRTSRSGGKGGQNVNKVETKVEGLWNPASSILIPSEKKEELLQKLAHRLNKHGEVSVISQSARTQLQNRDHVIDKMNDLLRKALKPKKPRIATRPTKASVQKRLDEKKKMSSKKQGRQMERYWKRNE